MSDIQPSRLDLLRFLERVQIGDLERTRGWIQAEEQRLASEAKRVPPAPPPDWLLEHGIGVGRAPVRVHVGSCWDTRSRCLPVERDAARRALAEGVEACTHCRPDNALGVLD
ncbi:DUF6233 domain-containing protein [Streptomyces sp. NBC_01351]|uniref:DUF6233 domain-containing protein n=1 Tax=Streptomyces sp. NBC_01351 TaxID=2903833 RepID=UPI002E3684BA|nr:DUF6233 domain-containing protein [Streptomyces sp. NBC_01351]